MNENENNIQNNEDGIEGYFQSSSFENEDTPKQTRSSIVRLFGYKGLGEKYRFFMWSCKMQYSKNVLRRHGQGWVTRYFDKPFMGRK